MKKPRIYLDNAATTPVDKRVSKIMRDFELEYFGNPNSIHSEGQAARAEIDTAREAISKFFACKPQEIVFTSGATESNNFAIQGIIAYCLNAHNMKPHVITTQIEHQSVYNVVKKLEERGVIEATFVKPDSNGLISAEDIYKEIKENTVLISTIFVSNEIGTIMPIRELGKLLEEYHKSSKNKIIFHTDAVQAVKFYNCNVDKLGVDLLTFSAHKINGPKGIGGLYIKAGTKLENLMFGGSQEYALRPGTQNSAGIIGMAKAFELLGPLEQRQKTAEKIRTLKDDLIKSLKGEKSISFNGATDADNSAPDILNLSIKDQDQESLIAKLDIAGFAVSTGSACVSGSTEPSHVILALGKGTKGSTSTIRVSIGANNTKKEISLFSSYILAL